jgi:hypothetical protein
MYYWIYAGRGSLFLIQNILTVLIWEPWIPSLPYWSCIIGESLVRKSSFKVCKHGRALGQKIEEGDSEPLNSIPYVFFVVLPWQSCIVESRVESGTLKLARWIHIYVTSSDCVPDGARGESSAWGFSSVEEYRVHISFVVNVSLINFSCVESGLNCLLRIAEHNLRNSPCLSRSHE